MALEDYPEIAALREKQEPLKTDEPETENAAKLIKTKIKADLIKGLPTAALLSAARKY